MGPQGYAMQLRTLRAVERQRSIDLSAQAEEVFALRTASIYASHESDERKAQQIAAAERQWTTFMGRPMEANG